MDTSRLKTVPPQGGEKILGYLNFSSGADDPVFLTNFNQLFAALDQNSDSESRQTPTAELAYQWLKNTLVELVENNSTFRDAHQASEVLQITFEELLPAYLVRHRNLLFHQDRQFLFNSFFCAQAMQAVLQAGPPWDQVDRIVDSALAKLNNYLGHRPVATLETQKVEPYENEWIAPVPIYLRSVGSAYGPYRKLIETAIEMLRQADPAHLRDAHFNLDRMDVLAIDPRAFDFDHPINKRPNFHFGQWDEHTIKDEQYRRFIVHQVTLDSLLSRVQRGGGDGESLAQDELLVEAGAVLACTMLMASGVSGSGPGAFASSVTLGSLIPIIVAYRDQFYFDCLDQLPPVHRNRLKKESRLRGQPFGAARQDLNSMLGKRRALQLVNCRMAAIFARMGYSEAADKQSRVIPVASARILCQIDCLLSSANQAVKKKQLSDACQIIPKVFSLLNDGVECGAIVDPWNILGFDANYSLFPAYENTVADHRVFDLVDLVERILGMCSRIWSEAAAAGDRENCETIRREFAEIVAWWRKFAPHEVMVVDAVDPQEIFSAAEFVAQVLTLWNRNGGSTADVEFWKQHAAMFDSPKAYQLVIDALLDRGDYQTSSALLVNWLNQSATVRLQHGDSSFHNLIWQWITEQKGLLKSADFGQRNEVWNRIRRFFDFIEANAGQYGDVPTFQLADQVGRLLSAAPDREPIADAEQPEFDDPDYDESKFEQAEFDNDPLGQAWEDVSFTDSANDGMEGPLFEYGQYGDEELAAEVDRLFDRLEFLGTLANFWRIAATFPLPIDRFGANDAAAINQLKNRRQIFAGWIERANFNRGQLTELLHSVMNYKIPNNGADPQSLSEYDRCRQLQETVLEKIVETCVESEHAVCVLAAVIAAIDSLTEHDSELTLVEGVNGNAPLVSLMAAVILMDLDLVRESFLSATEYLHSRHCVYVPLSRGGNPVDLVAARVLQEIVRELAESLPILGLFIETYELVQTALSMERNARLGGGAVTQFDELFEVAYTSMVRCLAQSTRLLQRRLASSEEIEEAEAAREAESILFESVRTLTDSMSILWLSHSQSLRLSALEKFEDRKSWKLLIKFIQDYGAGLFTQQLLQLSNARAILHQDVGRWLDKYRDSCDAGELTLFDDLDKEISRASAVNYVTLILEAICENFNEYLDYNMSTTQSDHGEMLYTFLDFIRLRNRYDRVCWYLKPIVWGHEILVRDGQNGVARMWRRSLTQQIGPEADRYLKQLQTLRQRYSMPMESIARRLEGRFVQEMQIDRLRSLVGPAMEHPESRKSQRAFEKLFQETQAFIRATDGVGVDLPAWLAALEDEVLQHDLPLRMRTRNHRPSLIQAVDVPMAQLREQIEMLPMPDD